MPLCCMIDNIMFLFYIAIFISIVITLGHLILQAFRKRRVTRKDGLTLGIFHPYCNAGGGGEKVLWCAIRAIQQRHPDVDIVVYTGDTDAAPADILELAAKRLNTPLPRPVSFVYLRTRTLVEAKWYPVCTLLGQSIGSIILGLEAMWRYLPDIYIDTMGYAFTLPLFSLVGGCKVACYVHYPTITTEMLLRVSERVEAHNNRAVFARSPLLTQGKLVYYRMFAWLYRAAGRSADVVMVNSSWTRDHIVELWRQPAYLVYPPCDVTPLKLIQRQETEEMRVLSLGQFRPEKDHPLQIKAFQIVKSKVSPDVWSKVRLVLVGSCRNSEDESRVAALRQLATEAEVSDNVEFKVNVSFDQLKREFSSATIGLHTMWNEHFGIGVVECMAAGLIMLAHKSGGPKMDIVNDCENDRTGFLAETAEEFADAIVQIVQMPKEQLDKIRKSSRESVERFSIPKFEETFLSATINLLNMKKDQ
ncbi:GDP-Man:Man(3)GlcNAc(2)-PP-Dol alpha-1,2-mannosyltransferase-like [Macrosteles quadrilineatus]|uniref:GDP-Man:Man(3)GlcNAc(2)-PP-Dol alpha-1,2-mannosyltransferase-like n=1 Tax=Macrosteles quadrilineatus TaxID=74068 RepID=UPI0023E17163|nr:GDP-Man:Man(3)GlcNAc(2)-PP-Dol alpha-1,2-mannosyltransferase-like [Macrosteles quadrilineatus]XP_054275694.1 GDP-Man:Man(3)GlcNAc(2)-PP-Dol alpha-1,2-mannosyltransferase-like [Macrosteles quadrilineatus]